MTGEARSALTSVLWIITTAADETLSLFLGASHSWLGSLDTEKTLPQAYKALVSVTEGRKLVGIISHVTELKEKIDKQIVVEKDRTGRAKARLVV